MHRKILFLAASLAMIMTSALHAQEQESLAEGLYAKISTAKGVILLRLEYKKTPLTVMSFVGLAEGSIKTPRGEGVKFFDGTKFHRVEPDFVIQGGDPNSLDDDPSNDGRGGPGYKIPNEIHPSLKHEGPGVLAMANSGPDTNGSQFYITLKDTGFLDGKYTVFGRVVSGQEVVGKIARGDAMEKVEIQRVGAEAQGFKVTQDSFDAACKVAWAWKKLTR
ncbi:MAG: peptidylprolyl isomerase [Planctomycetes bacterium]|nr:peptidylprolyl isomerase [Planctomycetota bacterium]